MKVNTGVTRGDNLTKEEADKKLSLIQRIIDSNESSIDKLSFISIEVAPIRRVRVQTWELIEREILNTDPGFLKTFRKDIWPGLENGPSMRGTSNFSYFKRFLWLWIYLKGKGNSESQIALRIHAKAKEVSPKAKLPHPRGTPRTFKKLEEQVAKYKASQVRHK